MALLINEGAYIRPDQKQLRELFHSSTDFLQSPTNRLTSARGYGNMPNCSKLPTNKNKDVNMYFPEHKLHTGVFHNVYTDFPKGAGGVSPNPMWADGTYEEMKQDFMRQADEQIDSENIRNLMPERDLRYDLAKYSGGVAQQNKLDFAVREIFNEEERLKDEIKRQQLRSKTGLNEDQIEALIRKSKEKEILRGFEKSFNLSSDAMESAIGNLGNVKQERLDLQTANLWNKVHWYNENPGKVRYNENPPTKEEKELIALIDRDYDINPAVGHTKVRKSGSTGVKHTVNTDAELYRLGRIREMGGVDYTGGGVPPEMAPTNTKPDAYNMYKRYSAVSAIPSKEFEFENLGPVRVRRVPDVYLQAMRGGKQYKPSRPISEDEHRIINGALQGLGSMAMPTPLMAGGGGSGGGIRSGGGTTIQPHNENSWLQEWASPSPAPKSVKVKKIKFKRRYV